RLGGAVLEEAEVLEDDSQLAPQPRDVGAPHDARGESRDAHFAGRGSLLEEDQLENRALAGAARAREENEFPLADVERKVGEGGSGPRVDLRDLRESNHGILSDALPVTASPSPSNSRQFELVVIVSSIALRSPITIGPRRMPTRPNV